MKNSPPDRIAVSDLPEISRLFLDFASSPFKGINPYLGGIPDDALSWGERLKSSLAARRRTLENGGGESYGRMMDRLVEYNSRLGANENVLGKLERAAEGDACFVLTGQQPGVLGGALMVLYKAVTAVALSERIEKMLSVDCIPLFWIGSDDTDFQEIRSLLFLAGDLSVKTATLPPEAHESSRPIGDISKHWSQDVWDGLRQSLAGHPGYGFVDGAVKGALQMGGDHAEVAAILLTRLLDGRIATVDGREASLRVFCKRIFAGYLEHENAVKASLKKAGEELRLRGYHSQLASSTDSGIFLMRNGRRTKVPPGHEGILHNAIDDSIEDCSPGVVLRNLVQDYSFTPVAVVLGPAELAYRAQMHDIYERFQVPFPVAVPRMSATLLPEKIRKDLVESGVELRGVVMNPSEELKGLFEGNPEVREALREFLTSMEKSSKIFMVELRKRMSPGVFAKLQKQMDGISGWKRRLPDLIDESAREELLTAKPWLRDVENLVRPRGKAQERFFSMLLPFLFAGRKGMDLQVDLGRRYIGDVMDGRIDHFLYGA